ncbi:MAG TPA: hypothetical protein VEX68_28195 [Bryobacteraceae bacterium]|nr:hypothetical protein [Bryobacteraceae bacterium]
MQETDIYALIGALVICAAYALAASIRRLSTRFKKRWAAASAGVSLAYVFLDIIPELAERSHVIQEAARHAFNPIKRIYAITLMGMLTFVALAHVGKSKGHEDHGEQGEQYASWYFLVHVGGFVLYNVLIGFLAVGRAHDSIPSLCIFVFAIALHMVMIDGMLTEIHGRGYTRWGRKALALGVLIGWWLGSTGTLSELAFSRLFAFLAGGIVITSANEEFPREDQGRFWYFVGGAMLYATVLVQI